MQGFADHICLNLAAGMPHQLLHQWYDEQEAEGQEQNSQLLGHGQASAHMRFLKDARKSPSLRCCFTIIQGHNLPVGGRGRG
eukprot:3141391-Pleurochrysis_carterae.AAC.1